MGSWSCQYCTLHNAESSMLCAACGSQNPMARTTAYRPPHRLQLPSLPKLLVSTAMSAIDSALSSTGLISMPLSSPHTQPSPSATFYTSEFATSSGAPTRPLPPSPKQKPPSRPLAPKAPNSTPKASEVSNGTPQLQRSCSSRELQHRDEQAAVSEFTRITNFCRTQKIPFIDDRFPHSERSLGNLSANGNAAVLSRVSASDLVWLRPQQILTKDGRRYAWAIFNDPKASDIEQGALGNCWFLSALAVIAERPDILEQIVLTKVINPYGVYQIRLCVDGRWQVVLVDDFFPCHSRSHTLAFAVGRRNQLWVSLIEKAFAKITGSYSKLLAGRTTEGLAVLTGAPCALIDLEEASSADSKNLLWASLLSMREARFVMGCSCGAGKRPVDDAKYKAVGLQPRHAYSFLDVVEFENQRLVRLRNPWGTFTWNGEWSDNWSGWNAARRAKLLPSGPETGAFWMPFAEFLRYFDSVDVAKVRSAYGWKELRIRCTVPASWWKHKLTGICLHLAESSEVALTFYQKGTRSRRETDLLLLIHGRGPESASVGELVGRSDRKMAAFVSTGDVFLRGPAEYVVLAISFSNLHDSNQLDGVVAIHSAKSFSARVTQFPPTVVTDSLVELMLKEGKRHTSLQGVVPRYLSTDFGGHLLMIDNLHERLHLHVHCDCSQSTNVLSTRFVLSTLDSVPPLHRQIIMLLSHFEPTQGYGVRHNLTQRLTSFAGLRDWVSLVPGNVPLPANTEHVPSFDDPAVAVLHKPRPLFH